MVLTARERNEYLEKAKWAEQMAAQLAGDEFYRTSWLNIAQGYRKLLEDSEKPADSGQPKL